MRKSTHTAEYRAVREGLVAMRGAAGVSQRELARRLRVPHTWVAKVESGERRIDLIEFGWFCAGCGVDAGEAAQQLLGATAGRKSDHGPRGTRVRRGGA